MDKKTLLLLAALGIAGYFIYRSVAGVASAAKAAFTTAGEALGSGLFDFFHPDPLGETTFYTVLFPDGLNHTVPAGAVGSDGTFLNRNLSPLYAGDGKRYQLVVDKRKAAGINKVAFPV